jgi:hypothetical protein
MRRMRRSLIVALAVLLPAATLLGAVAGNAGADPTDASIQASFNGGTIDLASGWGAAHACLIVSATDVECFATSAEMTAALADLGPVPDTSCGSGSLQLYQDKSYGGLELALDSPIDSWINLNNYGFGDETSSWKNTLSCDAAATQSASGSGNQLAMPAGGESGWVGSDWNDSINAVEIQT